MRFMKLLLFDMKDDLKNNFAKSKTYLELIKNLIESDISFIEFLENNSLINEYLEVLANAIKQKYEQRA